MPRKTEIQAEETLAISSPLRRSSRINVTTNPTSTAAKNLQSAIEASEVKGVKTRRASLSQESADKDEKKENKPIPRGRRGSTARDETEQKPEPTKIRTRRSSANIESVTKAEETEQKPEPTKVRTRRSSANIESATKTEEIKSAQQETPRQLRSRRSSVTDKPEENTEKVNNKGKKDEDSVRKPIRGRRGSHTDTSEEPINIEEEKEKKRPTRGRRASTEKLEDEPEPKSSRLTPSKSRRRPSVTDNAVNLEPIEEQESEIKSRKSTTPEKGDLKVVLTTVSPNSDTSEEIKQSSNETRTTRLTPVKSRRRLSVTEKAINLEPIEEQELETNGRKSKSPPQTKLKVVLSPVLTEGEIPVSDLISKSQLFTTERDSNSSPMELEKTEQRKVHSPCENSEKNTNTTSLIEGREIRLDGDETEETIKSESPISIVENDGNFVLKEDCSDINEIDDCSTDSELVSSRLILKKNQSKGKTSNLDLSVIEENSFTGTTEELPNTDKPDRTSPKNSSPKRLEKHVKTSPETLRKSPRLMKQMEMTEERNIIGDTKIDDESDKIELEDMCAGIEKSEDNMKILTNENTITTSASDINSDEVKITEISNKIDLSVNMEEDIKSETDIDPSTKTGHPNISTGSDGSFRFHLNVSVPSTNSEHISQRDSIDEADDLNVSKTSNVSDKENREINIPDIQSEKQVERKLIHVTNPDSAKSQDVIVARVSNVFRPRMKENSFVEPMEVDEYSYIQDTTINKLPNELNKSDLENVSPAKSTPIASRNSTKFNKHEHMIQKQSTEEGDSVNESFKLNLSISNIGEDKLEADNIKEKCVADNEYAQENCMEITNNISVLKNSHSENSEDLLKSREPNQDIKESSSPNSQQNNIDEMELSENLCLDTQELDTEKTTPSSDKVVPNLEQSNSHLGDASEKMVDEPHENVYSDKEEEDFQQENSEQTEKTKSVDETSETTHSDNFNEIREIQEQKIDLLENEDKSCQSPKTQKLDASDEYEFDIPSDEEDTEHTQKDMLISVSNDEDYVNEDDSSNPSEQKLNDDEDIAKKSKPMEISKCQEPDVESRDISKCIINDKDVDNQETEKECDDEESEVISLAASEQSNDSEFYNVPKAPFVVQETIVEETRNSQQAVDDGFTSVEDSEKHDSENQNDSENIELNQEASISDNQFRKDNIDNSEVDEMVNDFNDVIKDDKEQNTTEINEEEIEKLNIVSEDAQMSEVEEENCKDIVHVKEKEFEKSTFIQNTKDSLEQSTDSEKSPNLMESLKSIDMKTDTKNQKKKNKKSRKSRVDEADVYIEENNDKDSKVDTIQNTSKEKKSKRISELVNESNNLKSNKEDEESSMKDSLEASNKGHTLEHGKKEKVAPEESIETDKIMDVKTPMKKSKKSKKNRHSEENENETEIIQIEESEVAQDMEGTTKTYKVETFRKIKNKKLTNIEKYSHFALDQYLLKKCCESENENEDEESSGGQAGTSDEEEESEFHSEESEQEENEFISTMAEEGEEDTPSEGSNDIIDEGESINSTESEIDSDDDYDENDSFICDDDNEQLLSGNEYDLGDENKKKKSRIIQLEDFDDDIIKIEKKEKPIKKKKKSRIITIVDSSESEEDKPLENNMKLAENVDSISQSVEKTTGRDNAPEELQDEEMICSKEAEKESPILSGSYSGATSMSENEDHPQKSKRTSLITIHENINVKEIKDAALSERISSLVDTFCTSMKKGEISMNLSLEYAAKDSSEGSPQSCEGITEEVKEAGFISEKIHNKSSSLSDDIFESEEKQTTNKRLKKKLKKRKTVDQKNIKSGEIDSSKELSTQRTNRLSVTLDDMEDSDETEKIPSRKRRLSKSLDNLNQGIPKKKSKHEKKWKKEFVSKKKMISPKVSESNKKQSSSSKNDSKPQSFNLLKQLITDVKNRPVRSIVPSKGVTDMNSSWITEVADIKPSTTIISQRERIEHKLKTKIHPKDFRSQMLSDSSRVKRVDTKVLLRKKGAYF